MANIFDIDRANNTILVGQPSTVVTLGGQVIIPDGGTVGQVNGPWLIFDNTSNQLEITGCDISIGKSNPTTKLDVNGTIQATGLKLTNTITEFSTDGTLGDNSDSVSSTQKAIKTYVDNATSGAGLNAFTTITGITNDVVAEISSDILTLASANARLAIVGTTATDTITFTADTDLHNYSWTNADGTDLKTGSVTQAFSAALDDLTNVGVVTGDSYFLVGTGAGALAWENAATAKTSIGLGATATLQLGRVIVENAGGQVGANSAFVVNSTSSYIGINFNAPAGQNVFFELTEDYLKKGALEVNAPSAYAYVGAFNGSILSLGCHADNGANRYLNIDALGNTGIGGQLTFGTNMTKGFAQANGVAPTTSPANCFQMYSANIVAGHAACHIRNENDTIIKLYQQAHIADAPGDTTGNNATTINAILIALENNGLLANA